MVSLHRFNPQDQADVCKCRYFVDPNGREEQILMMCPLHLAAPALLFELKMIEAGWAARDNREVGYRPLTVWEKDRLMFLRDAIAKAAGPQAR